MFECLHERAEFQCYVPLFGVFYGNYHGRVFLVREEGELRVPIVACDSVLEDDVLLISCTDSDDSTAGHVEDLDGTPQIGDAVMRCIRSRRAFQQGCVLATLGSLLRRHLQLHAFNKDWPLLRIVGQSDDTYVGGPPRLLYPGFAEIQRIDREECDVRTNTDKLKALCPRGGVEGIPDSILEAQGGEIHGFKCVGAFVGAPTDAGTAYRTRELAKVLASRLAPLDSLDTMHDSPSMTGVRATKYGYLRRCANRLCNHWQRLMPPSIVNPVLDAVVEPRLRATLELISQAAASDPATQERWWRESALPTDMGGVDVGGTTDRSQPAFCSCLLACCERLIAQSTPHTDLDIVADASPTWEAMRAAYAELSNRRDAIAARHSLMDAPSYTTVRGGLWKGYYRPAHLPKALPPLAELASPSSNKPKVSVTQRLLTKVNHHGRWLDCLDAAHGADAENPTCPIAHREATRFISVSQPGAGAAFDVSPDGTFATTVQSLDFTVMMQWRGGLDIAEYAAVSSGDEEGGAPLDRRGDSLANSGEYNRRHNRVLRANLDMVSAVAIGPVVQGDKAAPEKTAPINETHVLDIAEVGGDETTGADVCIEVKCPSSLTLKRSQGKGSVKNGGQPAKVGHRYAFGNTEEWYRRSILGCKRRGRRADGPLNHDTGRGFVPRTDGQYADALRKGNRVVTMIVESHGGITPHALSYVGYLSGRARSARARDSTVYGRSRTSPRSFYTHHLQRISLAAQLGNAKAIRMSIRARKLKAFTGGVCA